MIFWHVAEWQVQLPYWLASCLFCDNSAPGCFQVAGGPGRESPLQGKDLRRNLHTIPRHWFLDTQALQGSADGCAELMKSEGEPQQQCQSTSQVIGDKRQSFSTIPKTFGHISACCSRWLSLLVGHCPLDALSKQGHSLV